jgi:hypothetical protein
MKAATSSPPISVRSYLPVIPGIRQRPRQDILPKAKHFTLVFVGHGEPDTDNPSLSFGVA